MYLPLHCRHVGSAAGSAIALAVQTRHHSAPGLACQTSPECDKVGNATFWTLLHYGSGQSVVALRNVIEQSPDDGKLMFVKLAKEGASQKDNIVTEELINKHDRPGKPVRERCQEIWGRFPRFRASAQTEIAALEEANSGLERQTDSGLSYLQQRVAILPGEGFGQFCRLSNAASDRLLTYYKCTSGLHGQSNSKGVNVADASQYDQCLANLSQIASSLYSSIVSDADVQGVEDVQNMWLPFQWQDNFKIHLAPMKAAEAYFMQVCKNALPQIQGLSSGWPNPFDVFQNAPFTGSFHGVGVVPAISKQQFVCGSGCHDCWVRFDKADLETYDHNLEGIPILEDETGLFFPVTHLWIDFCFPDASYAQEWFYGGRCLVRKKLSLWPMPKPFFERLICAALDYVKRKS